VSDEQVLAYRCAAAITWVKDAGRTLLVEVETGRAWSLGGVEAVVWDLLTLHYPAGQLIGFLAVLLGESCEKAKDRLLAMVQGWEEAGIVYAVRANGRG
jgi:hypothetical protein